MKNVSELKGYDGVFSTRLRYLMSGDDELLNPQKTTQEELAKATGITRQTISQYMDGSILPNIEKMYFIARHFNVSTDYLLGLTDTPAIHPNFREICDFTGLSTKSVMFLHFLKNHEGNNFKLQILDALLSDLWIEWFLNSIYEYTLGVAIKKVGSTKTEKENSQSLEKEIDYAKFLFSRRTEEEFEKLCNDLLPWIEEKLKSIPKYKCVERKLQECEEQMAQIDEEREKLEKKFMKNEKTIIALEQLQKKFEDEEREKSSHAEKK